MNNYAFIDAQNLILGIWRLGWRIDYEKLQIYLKEKYNVRKIYWFTGFLSKNLKLYEFLQGVGYTMIFKPVSISKTGKIKGNCDGDMILQAMIDFNSYNKAVIITSDGDFYSLVNYLYLKNKLDVVLSPCEKECSGMLKKHAREKIFFINCLRNKLERNPKRALLKDETFSRTLS
ncbi:MAG: NYN domain-containing protein [Candidatus Peregrinibacteria bacterium]|nr:NYN domain-containing protein [Candidatus Peregrinibacteria bacterium]